MQLRLMLVFREMFLSPPLKSGWGPWFLLSPMLTIVERRFHESNVVWCLLVGLQVKFIAQLLHIGIEGVNEWDWNWPPIFTANENCMSCRIWKRPWNCFSFFPRCFPVCEDPSADWFWGDSWQPGTLHWCEWGDRWFTFQGRRPLGQRRGPPPRSGLHEKEKPPSELTVACC